jgi:hypothetical protein
MLFSNFAVVSSGCCYCFPWKQLLFSPDVVTCFPDIAVVFSGSCRFCFMFLYKKQRKFQHVFSDFPVFFYSDPGFFCFFLLTFSVEKSVFF